MSHPELSKTTENISISMPSVLIELVDQHCQLTDLSRSALITRAVRKYLLTQADNPAVWREIYRNPAVWREIYRNAHEKA